MFTITRRSARILRSVLRRAFGSRAPGPALCFTAAAGTLSVRAKSADVAVEHRMVTDAADQTLWLPFQFLSDCEGRNDEPVQIEASGKAHVAAQWRDGNVPQIVKYDSPDHRSDADEFPTLPGTFAENPPGLLKALVDAGDTTDPDSARFSLGHLQLQPGGVIAATDGRQLLAQSGFAFPWEEAVLVPRSRVFSSPGLPRDQPVRIGRAGDWVALHLGEWTVWLAVHKDRRFPDVERHIPQPADAVARCRFSAADAEFLVQALPKLPTDEGPNWPVTVDLNGQIAVRAKGADQTKLTELILNSSTWSGQPIRINTNRQYLARAMKLGLREMSFESDKSPIVCQDESRRYVWMPLDPESALAPGDDAVRIESSPVEEPASSPKPKIRRKVQPVSEQTNNRDTQPTNSQTDANGHEKTNGHARKGTGRKTEARDTATLIEQAEKFRTALHELTLQANGLVKSLKQHRRQSRMIQNTLDSIRQLKGLGV